MCNALLHGVARQKSLFWLSCCNETCTTLGQPPASSLSPKPRPMASKNQSRGCRPQEQPGKSLSHGPLWAAAQAQARSGFWRLA
jgi:hypothetical protein